MAQAGAQALPLPNWGEVLQSLNTLSTNMALVPNTAPVIQAQALADLQASVAALQGLPDMMLQLTGQLAALRGDVTTLRGDVTTLRGDVTTLTGDVTTLTGDVTTLRGDVTAIRGDVTALTQNVANLTVDVAANGATLQQVNGSVELLNWKVEAADIRTRNQYLRLEDPITPIRVRPGQPPWPENFVYPATCKDLRAIPTHDRLDILLDGYQLPKVGTLVDKTSRLAVFICGTMLGSEQALAPGRVPRARASGAGI